MNLTQVLKKLLQDPTLKTIKNESSVNNSNKNESSLLDGEKCLPGEKPGLGTGIKMKTPFRGSTEPAWLPGLPGLG